MELGLKNKVFLCMASAAGLGKGIATEAAREGAKVMICTSEAFKDQLYAAQDEIGKETGNRPEAFICDVNSAERHSEAGGSHDSHSRRHLGTCKYVSRPQTRPV